MMKVAYLSGGWFDLIHPLNTVNNPVNKTLLLQSWKDAEWN